MIVWCSIMVTIISGGLPWRVETAAKGKVTSETKTQYVIDFSKYASEHEYYGNYSSYTINKNKCLKETSK
jgi:hypothetical protein